MRGILALLGMIGLSLSLSAQINTKVYQSEHRIDTLKEGELSFELDNISFFKDNEYAGGIQKGYSLPGFWIQPKLVYHPLKRIKLELGAHLLRYWGASKYPCYAYHDIPEWGGEQYQHGFHALPWFRAQVDLSERFSIVLGDIYGGANHRLIEPLYNQELNLTSDPEAGLQILYDAPFMNLDVWVNWQSFIFREDTHQEAFLVGLSSRFNLNPESKTFHFYVPIQATVQHRGGEIDTIYTHSVQTLMNASVGVGGVWNVAHRVVNRIGAEADLALSYQQAGELWPFDSGTGLYFRAYADLKDFRVKAGYWRCKDFVSLLGSPFYGALSFKDEGTLFHSPQMATLGLEYARSLGHGFSIGADVDIYCHLKGNKTTAEGEYLPTSSATSFSAGVYLRINPSFLLWKKK